MLCPVCNGIRLLNVPCPKCRCDADDCGRIADWSGPYAPYSPVSQEPFFNRTEIYCEHIVYCSGCNRSYEVSVAEWESPDLNA